MLEFKIEPHVGIGPIKLGARRDVVCAALAAIGLPVEFSKPKMDYFFKSSIQVEYKDDTASFIGLASDETYQITYRGVNVFDTPASELFDFIAAQEGTGNHEFSSYEYCFPNQIVTLYEADPQYDRIRREITNAELREIWGQIGLGDKRYLDAVNAIKNRHS